MPSEAPSPTAHPVVSQMKKTEAQSGEAICPGTHSRSASESKQDLKSTSYPQNHFRMGSLPLAFRQKKFQVFFCYTEERTQQHEGFHFLRLLSKFIERKTKSILIS